MVWGRPFLKGHPKTGGRTKGTPNRKTVEKRLAEEQARKISSDLEPLEYMLEVMRDPTADQTRRDMMAKAAAPYRHPQLQAVAHKHLNADRACDRGAGHAAARAEAAADVGGAKERRYGSVAESAKCPRCGAKTQRR